MKTLLIEKLILKLNLGSPEELVKQGILNKVAFFLLVI
jgi:hypothetical protein